MNSARIWRLAACLLLPICTGCGANSALVRGQSPHQANLPPQVTQNHQQVMHGATGHPIGWHPGHGEAKYLNSLGGLTGSHAYLHWMGCPHCHEGRYGQFPRSYHTFRYEQEQYSYPPANQPAAVVQYPYYTLKGPDDFFLK
jgi:hypothetical protein